MPTLKSILYKSGYFKLCLVALVVVFTIFLGMVINKVHQVITDKSFIESTVPANAIIIEKHNSSTIEYEFFTTEGKKIKSKINTQPSYIKDLKPRDTIAIFYDPKYPKDNFLPQELKVDYVEGIPALFIAFIALILPATILVVSDIREAKAIFNLFQNGIKATAIITKIEIYGYGNDYNSPSFGTMFYEFNDKNNHEKKGEVYGIKYKTLSKFIKPETEFSFKDENDYKMTLTRSNLLKDTTLDILYDPDNPDKSIWIDKYY